MIAKAGKGQGGKTSDYERPKCSCGEPIDPGDLCCYDCSRKWPKDWWKDRR